MNEKRAADQTDDPEFTANSNEWLKMFIIMIYNLINQLVGDSVERKTYLWIMSQLINWLIKGGRLWSTIFRIHLSSQGQKKNKVPWRFAVLLLQQTDVFCVFDC